MVKSWIWTRVGKSEYPAPELQKPLISQLRVEKPEYPGPELKQIEIGLLQSLYSRPETRNDFVWYVAHNQIALIQDLLCFHGIIQL